MGKSSRRPQASKRVRSIEMGEGFRELRKGSRAQPHRNLSRYDRNDYRNEAQSGRGW